MILSKEKVIFLFQKRAEALIKNDPVKAGACGRARPDRGFSAGKVAYGFI